MTDERQAGLPPCGWCGHADADHGNADPECTVKGCDCLAYRRPDERQAGLRAKAAEVLAGHTNDGVLGTPCRECAMLWPCHAWLLADDIRRAALAVAQVPAQEPHDHFAGEHDGCKMDVPHSHPAVTQVSARTSEWTQGWDAAWDRVRAEASEECREQLLVGGALPAHEPYEPRDPEVDPVLPSAFPAQEECHPGCSICKVLNEQA